MNRQSPANLVKPACLWAERARRLDFGGKVCFFNRPFNAIPTPQQWQALIDRVLAVRAEHAIDLVAIDPLAPYLRCENNAHSMFFADPD